MTFQPRVKTALACEMAQLNRDRFNEAVAANFYPCAPETRPGSSRIFSIEDCVALYIYARLIDDGVPPNRAGAMICEVFLPELRAGALEPPEHVMEVRTSGSRFLTTLIELSATHYGNMPVQYLRIWPVGNIRRQIIARLKYEFEQSPILGDD